MAAALIVIEVAAQQVSEDALAVLVSACTRAARDASCVLTKDASEERASAVAIVSVQAEDKMRVEVGVRQVERDSWRTKDFTFLPADETLDRWRAVGFAIGTLAESDVPTSKPAPEPPNVEPPRRAPPERVRETPRPAPEVKPRSQVFVGASALVGPGLDTGPIRLGGGLSALLAPPRVPLFFTLGANAASVVADIPGAAAGAAPASSANARWYDFSLGAGVSVLGPLVEGHGLELRVAALADYFESSALAGSRSATKSRWTLGAQASLGARLQIVPGVFLTAALDGAALSGATGVRVSGQLLGTSENFRYLGSLGLRVRLR